MTDTGPPPYRPILHRVAEPGLPFQPRGGGQPKTKRPTRARQGERLTGRFEELERLLSGGTAAAVTTSVPAGDPELVIVFEVLDTAKDVDEAFRNAGLEPLLDVEGSIDDEELGPDFERLRPTDPDGEPVKRYLHAAFANEAAARQMVTLWRSYTQGGRMPRGFGQLTPLFDLLRDVRPWGPIDRVRTTGLRELVAEYVGTDDMVPIQLELWFRSNVADRRRAAGNVRALIEPDGSVLKVAVQEDIGFHAVAAEVPVATLQRLVEDDLELAANGVALLRAPELLFVRPGGQHVGAPADGDGMDGGPVPVQVAPLGAPILAVLDGPPAANHPRLAGRLNVVDPDGIDGDPTYTVDLRQHGTSVAGAAIWGDLGAGQAPAARRVVVRPILRPDPRSGKREQIPVDELPADLTVRAVRDLVGPAGLAPGVRIVNLSVADPYGQFDTLPSAWARAIDYLAWEHNLLFIVAAGNHAGRLPIEEAQLTAVTGADRDRLMAGVLADLSPHRRLLTPAESLNALTVGALHADASAAYVPGRRIEPWGTDGHPSPVTAHGRGIRRAIKPDLIAPGGRQLYSAVFTNPPQIEPASSGLAPGVMVAIPPDREAYRRGTTYAAVETSRQAARIYDAVTAPDVGVADRFATVATKALVVHATSFPPDAQYGVPTDRVLGNGVWARDIAGGCAASQATILFTGELAAQTSTVIEVPFPAPFAGRREIRSVSATLAWLSPVNWRHREYRRAKLTLDGPAEMSSPTRRLVGPDYHLTQRGTVQHRYIETASAFAADRLSFNVKCYGQAGGFTGTVPFAVVVTLQIGAATGVDVYNLVRTELAARVRV